MREKEKKKKKMGHLHAIEDDSQGDRRCIGGEGHQERMTKEEHSQEKRLGSLSSEKKMPLLKRGYHYHGRWRHKKRQVESR
jgi:hypothetical protein